MKVALQNIWPLFAIAAAVLLLVGVKSILLPFVLGALVAYLFNPQVARLVSWRLPRPVASLAVVVFVVGIVAAVFVVGVPLLVKNVSAFAQKAPEYMQWVQAHGLPMLEDKTGIALDKEFVLEKLENSGAEIAGIAMAVAKKAATSTAAVADFLSLALITPLVMFYMLQDWPKITSWITAQLPRRRKQRILATMAEVDEALAAFLRGQGMVCVLLGLFYGVSLWAAGLDIGFAIGLATGVLSFIPFLGMALGLVAASIVAVLQYQFTAAEPYLILAAIFAAGQMLEGFVLTPNLVGGKVGVHPVWVIFAVLSGGALGGFLGVLVALPVATIAVVLVPKIFAAWRESPAFKKG